MGCGGEGVGLLERLKAFFNETDTGPTNAAPARPAPPGSTARPTGPRPKAPVRDPWVPFGQTVMVAGLTIHGGLLYVGDRMPTTQPYDTPEASLIRPSLTVDLARPDFHGSTVGYWPSYSGLTPQSRAGFLRWLAAGRNDPSAPLGFVFVYFYGLERRLLVDMHAAGTAVVERPVLLAEVRRLLHIYGHERSVKQYATGLLEAATPLDGTRRYDKPPPAVPQWRYEMSVDLAFGLGQLVGDARPVPVDWALAWWRAHPQSRPRTSAQRCPEEFAQVFAALYRERHGDGLVVKPPKRQLSWRYRAASPSLMTGFTLTTPVPDVRDLKGPFNKLSAIAETAMDLLDPYSRYLGKNPGQGGSPQAMALLPEQVKRAGNEATAALLGWATGKVTDYTEWTVRADDLIGRWGTPRFGKAEMIAAARLLGGSGVGIEQDVRFGGPVPKAGSKVVLFRRASPQIDEPSLAFQGAQVLLQLAGAVAAADGKIVEAEMRLLIEHVAHGVGLSADEQARLRAHLLWATETPMTPGVLRKRIDALTDAQKERAARLMVEVAAADGRSAPRSST